ncbi:MAG: PIN domain-containing protein, partial [Wenzhouxiangella sp.]|nr:PIN domain-containing protein [Wenzhouxiangella sp.]
MADPLRLYLLDTNVLMHDPTALFRFAEHDIYLPMIVLEELDRAKKGVSEVARNVRQVSRFIGQMMDEDTLLEAGLELQQPDGLNLRVGTGRLFFQTERFDNGHELVGDRSLADNEILLAALALTRKRTDREVVLVSKDINLRIKAGIHGVLAEDYHNDRALDDLSLLFTGLRELDNRFWHEHSTRDSWTEDGRTFYRMGRADEDEWYPNQCLRLAGDNGLEALVRDVREDSIVIEVAQDFRSTQHGVWGI